MSRGHALCECGRTGAAASVVCYATSATFSARGLYLGTALHFGKAF